MSTINKVILLGNVGSVDVQSFDGGGKLVRISLATSESYKKGDEFVEKTEWHRCVASIPALADKAEKLNKGDKIYIEGSISTSSWTNKEGENKESKDIFCNVIKVMSRKDSNASKEQGNSQSSAPKTIIDDLPFE